MLIKKINSVFMRHSRWLFGLFTGVIILSFVGFLTPTSSIFGLFGNSQDNLVGTVYGEKVTVEELQEQMMDLRVLYELIGMPQRDISPVEAFYSYCQQVAARKRGIIVTDSEVAEVISRMPLFCENGKFDLKKYEEVIKIYAKRGISAAMVSNAVRMLVIQQKLQQQIFSSVVCSPEEVKVFYKLNNAQYTYQILKFKPEKFKSAVKPGGEELKKYLAEHADNYRIPAQYQALAAAFPYSNFTAAAAKLAAPEKVKAFYDANPALFTSGKGENAKLEAFDAKKAEKLFAEHTARELALAKAQDFAVEVNDAVADSKDAEKKFRSAAAARSLKVYESGWFKAGDSRAGKLDEPEFARHIASSVSQVTDAVAGKNAALVGFVAGVKPSRNAEFNECAKQLMDDCTAAKTMEMAKQAAEKAAAELAGYAPEEIAAKAKSIANAELGAPVTAKISSFDAVQNPLSGAVFYLKPGEAGKVMMDSEGAVVPLLIKKVWPDMAGFDKESAMWKNACLQDKAGKAMLDFEREISENCKLNSRFQQR